MSDIDDITIRLARAALDPESIGPAEMEALLREAVQTIEALRMFADIREASCSQADRGRY